MYARYTEYLRDFMNNTEANAALHQALSTYPLYENEKVYDLIPTREQLNNKILNHYKYREIGFETFGRFLDELKITMEEIMPLYNEFFKSIVTMADIENPFDTVDMIETFEQTTTGTTSSEGSSSGTSSDESQVDTNITSNNTSSSTSNNTSNNKSVESDTPQDELSIGTKGINTVDFASKVTWNEDINQGSTNVTNEDYTDNNTKTSSERSSSDSSSSSSQSSGTQSHTYIRKGSQGVTTFGHDMIEFRQSFIDVMNDIVNDPRLDQLFMQVY